MDQKSHRAITWGIAPNFTKHAWQRMTERGLSTAAIEAALDYGRIVHVRGAAIFAIGKKEVARCQSRGINISDLEGVQVVCKSDGMILTVYRNRDFRGLRPRRRHFRGLRLRRHRLAA